MVQLMPLQTRIRRVKGLVLWVWPAKSDLNPFPLSWIDRDSISTASLIETCPAEPHGRDT